MKGISGFRDIRRKIIFDCFDRFPEHGNRTIAKKIYKEHPELFRCFETCCSTIRYYRGASGDQLRNDLATRDYVRE